MPLQKQSLLKTNQLKDLIDTKFKNIIEYYKQNPEERIYFINIYIDSINEEIKNLPQYKSLIFVNNSKNPSNKYTLIIDAYLQGQKDMLKKILIPHTEITKDGVKFYWTYPINKMNGED
jgi:hypothetical protein